MADAVSCIRIAIIAAVFDMRDMMLFEVFLDLFPRGLKQRADQAVSHRRDPRKSAGSGAAAEIHQHRLRIIIEVVRGSDPITAEPVGRLLQEAIAQRPGRILRAEPLLSGISRDIAAAHRAEDAEPFALLGSERRVPQRFSAAKPVVIVRREKCKAVCLPQFNQPVEQTHAVRTAGYRAQHSAPLRQHRVSPDQIILHRSGVPRRRRRYIPAAS